MLYRGALFCYTMGWKSGGRVCGHGQRGRRRVGLIGKRKRIVSFLLSVCLMAAFCGCGWVGEENAALGDMQAESTPGPDAFRLLPEAELDYRVPEQYPGVWVSLGGYDSRGNKEVYFRGRSLPDTFRIMDAGTGQCVYTGQLKEDRYDADTGEYNSYGEFTDFVDTGEYYIECDIIGRSYPFALKEGRLHEQFDLTLEEIRRQGRETDPGQASVRAMLQQVILVLLSYELYPDVYEDGDGNQIPDILEYMADSVRTVVGLQTSVEPDELTYELTAALAKYSYLYQKYDNKYATEIIQLAAGLWQQAEKTRADLGSERGTMPGENARLMAAAELYRATGQRKYALVLETGEESLAYRAEQGTFKRYDYMAAITYIATKQKVDVELCNRLTRAVMNRGEQIAAGIPRLAYREVDLRESALDDMMWDMAMLTVVDYVITNYEYGRVIESQYYFLWGRNARSYCFWERDISRQPAWTACYLMMLCQMRTTG